MCINKQYYITLESGSQRVKRKQMIFIYFLFLIDDHYFLVSSPSPYHLTKLHLYLDVGWTSGRRYQSVA